MMLMQHYSDAVAHAEVDADADADADEALQRAGYTEGFFLARTVFCAQGLLDETAEQVHGINVFDFKGTFLVKLHMLGIYDATYVCVIRHLKY